MKTLPPENKKASEAPHHLIFCGWLEDFVPYILWSGHCVHSFVTSLLDCDIIVAMPAV